MAQTVRITFRLRNPDRVSDFSIVLALGQTRRIRFAGVPVGGSSQGASRLDFSYVCD